MQILRISLNHHDVASDALACAQIVIRAAFARTLRWACPPSRLQDRDNLNQHWIVQEIL